MLPEYEELPDEIKESYREMAGIAFSSFPEGVVYDTDTRVAHISNEVQAKLLYNAMMSKKQLNTGLDLLITLKSIIKREMTPDMFPERVAKVLFICDSFVPDLPDDIDIDIAFDEAYIGAYGQDVDPEEVLN